MQETGLLVLLLTGVTCMGLPPLWKQAPGTLTQFPRKSGHTVIDPWNYLHRLGLYKVMLNVTATDMERFGTNNTGNILWGLATELGWQFKSGRLGNFDTGHNHLEQDLVDMVQTPQLYQPIYVSSWWASGNYYLSVVPFLAAKNAGMFQDWPHDLIILKPKPKNQAELLSAAEDMNKFCTTSEECEETAPASMHDWKVFFVGVKNMTQRDTLVNMRHTDPLDFLLKLMWKAHMSSVHDFLPLFQDKLLLLPEPEARFAISWSCLVDFFAYARLNTNLSIISKLQKLIPNRLLKVGDRPPCIPDQSWNVNKVLFVMETLHQFNRTLGGYPEKLWVSAMCSPAGRREGRYLLENFIQSPIRNIPTLFYIAWDWFTKPCDINA